MYCGPDGIRQHQFAIQGATDCLDGYIGPVQAGGDTQAFPQLAQKNTLDQAERVEAGAVRNCFSHIGCADSYTLVQQDQLIDFLLGGQQISFDQIRQQGNRFGLGFKSSGSHPALDPLRQLMRFDRPDLHQYSCTRQPGSPF